MSEPSSSGPHGSATRATKALRGRLLLPMLVTTLGCVADGSRQLAQPAPPGPSPSAHGESTPTKAASSGAAAASTVAPTGSIARAATAGASTLPSAGASPTQAAAPVAPPIRYPTRVVASGVRACAVFDDGALQCWGGFNFDGELGLGHTTTVKTPGWVAGIRGVRALALGRSATCATVDSGALYCWGRAIPDDFHARKRNTLPVELPGIANAVDVALGSDHACATDAAGALFCWGSNADGQLGLGPSALGRPRPEPVRVPGLPPVAGVRADDDVTVAWSRSGALFIWGQAGGGQSSWRFTSPHQVAGVSGVRKAWLTGNHTCALLADKQVRCFTHETLRDLEAGRQHDFGPEFAALAQALRKSGAPVTIRRGRPWGPLLFPDGRGLVGAIDVAVFNHDASALTESGEIYSWGNAERGTVGRAADSKGFYPPTRIEGVSDAVALAGSFLHRCALDRSGGVACFGEGGAGRLGTAGLRDSPAAVPVRGLPKIVHLASNDYCTFAIGEDHSLWAWGMSWVNACGIEGDGKTPTAGPTEVPLCAPASPCAPPPDRLNETAP